MRFALAAIIAYRTSDLFHTKCSSARACAMVGRTSTYQTDDPFRMKGVGVCEASLTPVLEFPMQSSLPSYVTIQCAHAINDPESGKDEHCPR